MERSGMRGKNKKETGFGGIFDGVAKNYDKTE